MRINEVINENLEEAWPGTKPAAKWLIKKFKHILDPAAERQRKALQQLQWRNRKLDARIKKASDLDPEMANWKLGHLDYDKLPPHMKMIVDQMRLMGGELKTSIDTKKLAKKLTKGQAAAKKLKEPPKPIDPPVKLD